MGDLLSKISKITLNDTSSQTIEPEKEILKTNSLNLQTPKRVFDVQLLDPRSATLGIKRTPIVLKNADSTNDTPIKLTKPYLETDLDAVTDTPKMSKFSLNSCLDLEKVSEQLDEVVVEDKEEVEYAGMESSSLSSGSEEDEVSESEEDVKKSAELPTVVVAAPEMEEVRPESQPPSQPTSVYQDTPPLSTPVKLKSGRTPLGLVSVNAPAQLQSPVEGTKIWRGFQEERIRLGLENTPPCMTGEGLPDRVQSAPGKVGHKRRDAVKKAAWAKTRWGLDDSVII